MDVFWLNRLHFKNRLLELFKKVLEQTSFVTRIISHQFPVGKKCFINQFQNNTRTNTKYTRTSLKHTGSGIFLILVYEIFRIGFAHSER